MTTKDSSNCLSTSHLIALEQLNNNELRKETYMYLKKKIEGEGNISNSIKIQQYWAWNGTYIKPKINNKIIEWRRNSLRIDWR